MIRGEAKMLRRRAAAACPDVKEMRQLLERATGVTTGSQKRLAELVGCHVTAIRSWEQGGAITPIYVARLVEVEAKLRARVAAQEPTPAKTEKALPLMANVVDVRVEGDQALIRFALKVPGEETARTVAEVLVPRTAIAGISDHAS